MGNWTDRVPGGIRSNCLPEVEGIYGARQGNETLYIRTWNDTLFEDNKHRAFGESCKFTLPVQLELWFKFIVLTCGSSGQIH